MQVYAVYIISQSGSLIYEKVFDTNGTSPIAGQTSNDNLVIAGNLHGIHTIASKLTPAGAKAAFNNSSTFDDNRESNRSGLRSVHTEQFTLHVHQTATGLKTVVLASAEHTVSTAQPVAGPTTAALVAQLQRDLHRAYTDALMRNPFYNVGMPARIPMLDAAVRRAVQKAQRMRFPAGGTAQGKGLLGGHPS